VDSFNKDKELCILWSIRVCLFSNYKQKTRQTSDC